LGEVGREGVSVATLDDMGRLFDGINLADVSTSMTINASAIVALAFYIATAEKQGVGPEKLRGTLQNDMLKEFIAQKEWIVPPRPSMRVIKDMISYCTEKMPLWNTISISGYHIREAGATAVQELAFTLADGIGYMDLGKQAGIDPDAFAGRLSFFFDVHNDFFEEVAKLRAARRMWAKITRERFGCKNPRSWILRTHCQTAGVSLTAQQPYNNVVRTTWQALAAVMGGTQSLHTNSLDETYALPTENAATLALRTQQLLLEEARVGMVADPLGGSYFVEALTDQVEEAAWKYINKIDELGGIVPAVEEGFPQREIAESAYRYQRALEEGDEHIVGITKHADNSKATIPTLKIDHQGEQDQVDRCKAVRARRNQEKAKACLARVEACCRGEENMMPAVIEAAKADCTLGEICDVFRKVWGVHRDPAYL
jgi:methylmalonyl-CoA mutase N-terminal domain/subunit